jgi:hypothetical protein
MGLEHDDKTVWNPLSGELVENVALATGLTQAPMVSCGCVVPEMSRDVRTTESPAPGK